MRSFRRWTLAVAALAVWVVPARSADNEKMVPEEGAVQVMLLRQKAVREDLKLTDDETTKIIAFTTRQWNKAHSFDDLSPKERDRKFEEMSRENERFLDEILEPAQRKRLNQITLQVAGLLWVTRPHVASEIGLTADQKQRARQYQQEARKEMEDLIHSTSREQRREKLRELRMTSRKRLLELLTDEQEVKWKEMSGEPFRGELLFTPASEQGVDSSNK